MARLLKIIGSVLGLVIILVGPPLVLLGWGSAYLPHQWPTPDDLTSTLTSRDHGEVFLGLLIAAGLIAWLLLVAGTVLELLGRLRGRTMPRIRGLGWAQAIAAVMLTALASTAHASPLAVIPGPLPASPPIVAAPAGQPVEVEHAPPVPSPDAGRTYVVQPGDTLMGIAARKLGDEDRYREIFALNHGRTQPDGDRLTDAALIKPGWRLQLPARAPSDDGGQLYTVRAGDTLSALAQTHLGDACRYPELYDLNQGRPQPNGHPALRDPDKLFPGQLLLLPAASVAAPGQPLPPTDQTTPTDGPEPEQPSAPTTGVVPPWQPAPVQSAEPSQTTPSPELSSYADSTDGEDDLPVAGPAVLQLAGLGGLLAAAVLAAIATRRWHTRRRRRPGYRLPTPPLTGLELAARAVESPATVELLDRSLRSLARHVAEQHQPLPAIHAATIGPHTVQLQSVQCEAAPVPPFGPGWTLDRSAVEQPPADSTADAPAPYPTLVTIGTDPTGQLVLINLEQAGAITLTGSPADIEAVLLAMAADLALATWADHATITLVGAGKDLATHLQPDRLHYANTVDEALHALARRKHQIDEQLQHTNADSIGTARGQGIAEDTWTPHVLLSAEPFTTDHLQHLAQLVNAGGPATGLAAVVVAEGTASIPGAWCIDTTAAAPTHLRPLDLYVTLQRLTPRDVADLISALAAASDPHQTPTEHSNAVPPEPADLPESLPNRHCGDTAADAEQEIAQLEQLHDPGTDDRPDATDGGPPEILLLGPVGIRGPDPAAVDPKKRNRLVELAAYLILNPGATSDDISRRLGTDDKPWSAATRQPMISRLRAWLGQDPDGNDYLPLLGTTGGYRLAPTLRCDWHRFQTLVHRALPRGRDGLSQLERALALVRGMPLSNTPTDRYTWAEFIRQEMIDTIVDVAHTVATLHTETGNLRAARTAITRGLQAEPVSELLHRDLLRIEYRANNLPGVRATATKLTKIANQLAIDLEPETTHLMRQLFDPHYRAGREASATPGT